MSMLKIMQKVAAQTGNAGAPAAFMFGTVTSAAPLVVRVDNRFDIGEQQLVVMKEFRSGEYTTHKHTIAPIIQGTEQTAKKETYTGLAEGDKVVLFRNQGGQQFLILGRM